MVAIRLGAAKAVGVDSDPVAIDCAQGYAQDNRFGAELVLQTQDLSNPDPVLRAPYDLVLANLDQATLMLCRDHLAPYVQRGARLLVSGVLVDQRQDLVQAFACAGMYGTSQREREGWVALGFQVAQSCGGT